MSDLVRTSLAIERPLWDLFEKAAKIAKSPNRYTFLCSLIRDPLVKEEWTGNEEVLATITLVYNHRRRQLTEKLADLLEQLPRLHRGLHAGSHRRRSSRGDLDQGPGGQDSGNRQPVPAAKRRDPRFSLDEFNRKTSGMDWPAPYDPSFRPFISPLKDRRVKYCGRTSLIDRAP